MRQLRYSLAMASRWRRALIRLGLQPEGSAGSPFPKGSVGSPLFVPPTYVCATCGALVAADRREQHDAWHQMIGG
jgi:hypothetical protein